MIKRFEEIPHTADWSFRAYGRDLNDLFANCAYAMFAMEGAIPAGDCADREIRRTVQVSGPDLDSVLVNWLNELLFLQDRYRETFHRFDVQSLTLNSLSALVFGRPNLHIDKLIKAATFHMLQIIQTENGWQAVVVVDV